MNKILVLFFISIVVSSWAAPRADELQELYVDACQASCGVVKNSEEDHQCREKFCPNYVSYLLTGDVIPGSTPSLASTQPKEVSEFCAVWMLNLIEELGWQRRIHLNIKECICAAGNDCLVK